MDLVTLLLFVLGILVFLLVVATVRVTQLQRRTQVLDRGLDSLRRLFRELEVRVGTLERRSPGAQPESRAPAATPEAAPAPGVLKQPAEKEPAIPPQAATPLPPPPPPVATAPRTPAQPPPPPAATAPRIPAPRVPFQVPAPPEPQRPSTSARAGIPPVAGKPAAKRSSPWEERIGTRLAVWVGAVALALAGLFLLRYVHQQGWVNPATRVLGAAGFGIALLLAGEWMRKGARRIAQGATAAGVAVCYGTVLAATQLYHFLSPLSGFALLAVVTVVAVITSIRQGPFVAILGLIGGFLTPVFIGTGQLSTVQLFGYLLLLEGGLLVLTHRRTWWWLGLATMAGGLGWAAIWIAFWRGHDPAGGTWVGMFLLLSMTMFVASSLRSGGRIGSLPVASLIPWSGVGIGMILVAWLLQAGEQSNLEWAYLGLLGAGCLVLARLRPRFFGLAALASAMAMVLLASWGIAGDAAGEPLRFGVTLLGLGLLFAGGAYANLWAAGRPSRWAAMVVLVALAGTLIGYLALGHRGGPLPWWAIGLMVGAVMAAMAVPVARRRASLPEGETALALLLTGVTGSVALAVPMFVRLHQAGAQWMTVAWALQIPPLLLIGRRLRVPALHRVAGALGILVAARLLVNPAVLTYAIGPRPVLNWLAYGYGVPLACFAAAAWLRRRETGGEDSLARGFEAGAMALGMAMATLMVRHGFHGDLWALGTTLYEMATYPVVWGLAAAGLLLPWRGAELRTLRRGGQAIAALSVLAALVGVGLVENPLWSEMAAASVGRTVVWNGLLYAIALPAALSAALAWLVRRRGSAGLAGALDSGALLLAMLTLALFVRHGFHPDAMTLEGGATLFELATCSIAWFALASMILALASRSGSPMTALLARALIVAALLALLVGPGLLLNPLWHRQAASSIGALPVFNGLLYVTLVPALLIGILSRQARRGGMTAFASQLEATGLVVSLVGGTLLLRHGFHAADMRFAAGFTLVELATYAVAWLAGGQALLAARRRWPHAGLVPGGQAMILLGLVAVWAGPLILANPVLAHREVGALPVLNWLLYAYGAPAILAGLAARALRAGKGRDAGLACSLTTLVLAFALVTLEVRQAFHGTYLDGGTLLAAESYAFSAAWVAFAVALLLLGIGTRSRMLRHASLAVMLLAVGKVFLFDTRHLEDLYRVLSFLGLGISLFGVAYVYQRFVFRADRAKETTPGGTH